MVYLISDVHGDYDLFVKLLKKINFSKNDKMIILGDMLDKGKKSIELLNLLFGENSKNFECIMGNHEYDFVKYYHTLVRSKLYNEEQIVRHCNDRLDVVEGLTIDMIKRIESLPFYIETEDYICVHAGVPLDDEDNILDVSKAEKEELVYGRSFKAPLILPKGKCVVFGHTPTFYMGGEIEIIAYKKDSEIGNKMSDYYKIHIDTGSYLTGVLGCWCVDECKAYYVNKWQN